jgi:hydrogenase nickel incorporation protein HypB
MEIRILKNILASNKQFADEIRALLKTKKIFMIDMMGSPGSGKTKVTDRLIASLKDKYRIAVIEADVSTTKDAEKLAVHNVPIIQIKTDLFGRECHVESSWVKKCLLDFELNKLDFVIIENIGNLVCPAEYELGDDMRIVVLSIAEGEDKPLKYPLMFSSSQVALLNKIDLLPHLSYDLNEVKSNIKSVNPGMQIFEASAVTGQGFDEFINYIAQMIEDKIR